MAGACILPHAPVPTAPPPATPAADAAPLLVARGLVRAYGRHRVLQGVDLALRTGDVLVIAGPNGAGKTTLLRVLAGLARPSAGRVELAGRAVDRADPESRRPIGLVSHQSLLYDDLTIRENLAFAARLYGMRDPGRVARQALAELGLEARGDDRPHQLSRGLLQRAAIARALLHRPALLLLDEPFTGLDAVSSERFRRLLAERTGGGCAMVLVTHQLEEGWSLATHVAVLVQGRFALLEPRRGTLEAFRDRYLEAVGG